jgi:hypothetical protein
MLLLGTMHKRNFLFPYTPTEEEEEEEGYLFRSPK